MREQWTSKGVEEVEVGGDDLAEAGGSAGKGEWGEFGLALDDDVAAALGDEGGVADELDGVAEALLGV